MITLLFSTSRGALPWLIRLLTRSRVSHCGIGASWLGVPIVIHASVGGVSVVPRSRWLQSHQLVEELVAPEGVAERLKDVVGMLDLPYDYVGLLGHIPAIIGRWLRRKVRNPFQSPNKLVCSELIVRSCEGIHAFSDLDPELASPEDVLEAALRSGAHRAP